MSATSYSEAGRPSAHTGLKQTICKQPLFPGVPQTSPHSPSPSVSISVLPATPDTASLNRRTIDISGLPFSAGVKDVYDLVKPYGDIDSLPRTVVGCRATVTFRGEESAGRAAASLNGAVLYNFRLSVRCLETNRPGKEAVWAGFLSKGKSRELVDLYPVQGDPEAALKGVALLRLSHRAKLEEVADTEPVALALIEQDPPGSAVHSIGCYLRRKQRAGFIQLRSYRLYLLPAGPQAAKFGVSPSENQLLCVFAQTAK